MGTVRLSNKVLVKSLIRKFNVKLTIVEKQGSFLFFFKEVETIRVVASSLLTLVFSELGPID